MKATYSPDDNKLRIYPDYRLDKEEYNQLKKSGFKWAPKQKLFVAPMWTPYREDIAIKYCGEIGDEDTTLIERAIDRNERFETYSDKRKSDAETAYNQATELSDDIPLGQPILIGHHSEKKARKQAEKIESAMTKAVKMWDTSEYWQRRADGVISSAKYKERVDVRARRIKKIEAGKRKSEKTIKEAETFIKYWSACDTLEDAKKISNYDWVRKSYPLSEYPRESPVSQYEGSMSLYSALDGIIDHHRAKEIALRVHERTISGHKRWITHYDNRLAYEKALLESQGGADLLKPKARPKQPPLLNCQYPDGVTIPNRYYPDQPTHYPYAEMTKEEYAKINKDYKGTIKFPTHRVRICSGAFAVKSNDMNTRHNYHVVFLTNSKKHEVPAC